MKKTSRGIYVIVFSIYVSAMTSACVNEMDYMAKYCGSTEVGFYIKKDLTTHYIPLYDSEISTKVPNVESGSIVKLERENYFEYIGSMNFIAFKRPQNGYRVPGYKIEFGDDFYSVESPIQNGNAKRYYINFEGSLYQIDQILYPVKGDAITLTSRLCGGDFKVI